MLYKTTFFLEVDSNEKLIEPLIAFYGIPEEQCKTISKKDFYGTLLTAIETVTSEYICFLELDEIFLPSGIQESVSFLEGHAEHVGCSGKIGGLKIFGNELYEYYTMFSTPVRLSQDDVQERIFAATKEDVSFICLRGGFFRTTVVRLIAQELRDLNIFDRELSDFYFFTRLLFFGKVEYSNAFYSKLKEKKNQKIEEKSWPERVLFSNWMQECEIVITGITEKTMSELEEAKKNEFHSKIKLALFESKKRVYHTDYFAYISLKDRWWRIDCWTQGLFKISPQFMKTFLFFPVVKIGITAKLFFKSGRKLALIQKHEIEKAFNFFILQKEQYGR